jgi:hypothetical protein
MISHSLPHGYLRYLERKICWNFSKPSTLDFLINDVHRLWRTTELGWIWINSIAFFPVAPSTQEWASLRYIHAPQSWSAGWNVISQDSNIPKARNSELVLPCQRSSRFFYWRKRWSLQIVGQHGMRDEDFPQLKHLHFVTTKEVFQLKHWKFVTTYKSLAKLEGRATIVVVTQTWCGRLIPAGSVATTKTVIPTHHHSNMGRPSAGHYF